LVVLHLLSILLTTRSFFDNYHVFLPVLDPSSSADEYYDSSPLLFWAIISAASRRYRDDSHLLMSLFQPVTQLAWKTASDPPIWRPGIQALLILCFWPFPSLNTMKVETSMNLMSIAVNSAMQIGLHRPEYSHEFGIFRYLTNRRQPPEDEKQEATKTWAACNIVAQQYVFSTHAQGLFSLTHFPV
jgi:hypothetical protein